MYILRLVLHRAKGLEAHNNRFQKKKKKEVFKSQRREFSAKLLHLFQTLDEKVTGVTQESATKATPQEN